jgi:hypothetical protein
MQSRIGKYNSALVSYKAENDGAEIALLKNKREVKTARFCISKNVRITQV